MFESDWGYAINSVEGGGRQGTDSTRKISYFKTWSYSGSADTSTISNFWQASSSGMHIVIIDNIFQKKPSHLFFFFFFFHVEYEFLFGRALSGAVGANIEVVGDLQAYWSTKGIKLITWKLLENMY